MTNHPRARPIRPVAVALLALVVATRLDARDFRTPEGMPDPARIGRPDPGAGAGEPSGRPDRGEDAADRPGRLDPILRRVDPARLQHLFDRAAGLDTGDRSDRPRAPEIGEPVFFDLARPLGDLKYANELNYLLVSGSQNAPTLQVIEYEYTFADWRSVELDLSYFNGKLEILTPFYQRTLGVGRRRNWAHGYQVSPDIYTRSGFVGGTAVYTIGWKPDEESRFSSLVFVGANRALIGGFNLGPHAPSALRLAGPSAAGEGDRAFGSWRPTLIVDLFYELGEKFSIGIENDLFFRSGKAGEYLAFPFLTYKPGKHFFIQAGGGYYRFESRDQVAFLLHVNIVNPSHRRPRAEGGRPDDPDGSRPRRRGLGRLLGDR